MKSIAYILFLSLLSVSCNKKSNETFLKRGEDTIVPVEAITKNNFEETSLKVLNAFKLQNDSLANQYVHTDKGVMVIYRTGVFNEYRFINRIDFKKPVPANFAYPSIDKNLILQYDELPKFNCGSMEWSKYGLYCDTIRKDTLLSGTLQNLVNYRGDNIPSSEVKRLKELEGSSRRVVFAQQGNSLIFYLTLIDNKWYLTAIDRITTDCSA